MDSTLAIKVGDFGLARDVYTKDYYRVSNVEAKIPIKWMAPEALYDGISNEKTDVVSWLRAVRYNDSQLIYVLVEIRNQSNAFYSIISIAFLRKRHWLQIIG